MNNLNKIPKEITIGGQIIKIEIVDSINSYSNSLGEACLGAGFIRIANSFRNNAYKQSDGSKLNTFYHELTHVILDNMGKDELSANEEFVSSFAGFLTEALTSAKY